MKLNKKLNGWIATKAIGLVGKIEYRRLIKACRYPEETAEKTLRGILKYAKDTEFGRKYGFAEILAAKNRDEFYALWRKNVPAKDFEFFRPMIERHEHGEADVLFPGRPRMYATTSGTTNKPKLCPMTDKYIDDVYGKMTRLWLYNFMLNRPKVFYGSFLNIVSRKVEGYVADGTIYGSVSSTLRSEAPGFIKSLYPNPDCVYDIRDYTAKYYVLMRMSVETPVSCLLTGNPSTIIELQNNCDQFFDEYINDIEHGTLTDKVEIEPEIRAEIQTWLKPNPQRAAELRELKAKYGRVLPKHIWPDIMIMNTMKCGNTRIYVKKFQGYFPKSMLFQELGYIASECRFGLCMDDSINTILFPQFHYYEFVAEEDIDTFNAGGEVKFHQVYELTQGKRYCPFVTTYSGLYRYNMNDLIEAGPRFENTNTVFMIRKINGIVNMTGEKLSEPQFVEAVMDAEKELGMHLEFFVGFAKVEESRYHFYFEFTDKNTSEEDVAKFTAKVDELLKEKNCEYEAKRKSFRINDPVGHKLVDKAFAKYKAAYIKKIGGNVCQFKLNLLLQDEVRRGFFEHLLAK